jgi:type I restriction enzyme, S subunit
MRHLNLGILGRLTIPLPRLGEQRAIAEVLGALDDKIAANAELASTADEFVRTSFTSLLTAEMTILGAISNNRRVGVSPEAVAPELPYVALEHIDRRSFWLRDWGRAADATSGKSRFVEGDVLFGKLRPYFHKVVDAPTSGICSTDIMVLTPVDQDLRGFLLAAVGSDAVVQSVTASSGGTRMPRTSWRDLAAVAVPWPGHAAARAFGRKVTSVREAVNAALRENRTLAATRDALLPQLMSGKLRVKDAERVVGEVV